MVQKGYGKYSTLPTFINQGIYDNNRRIFVEIPTPEYVPRYVRQLSPTEISVLYQCHPLPPGPTAGPRALLEYRGRSYYCPTSPYDKIRRRANQGIISTEVMPLDLCAKCSLCSGYCQNAKEFSDFSIEI